MKLSSADSVLNTALFHHYSYLDKKKERLKILDTDHGPHLFLRKVKIPVQARLAQLVSHENVPEVFLFGSPHVDNYTRTNQGIGLIDFDRAIIGPYFSDITYCLLSVALKSKESQQQQLDIRLTKLFLENYLSFIDNPKQIISPFKALSEQAIAAHEQDIDLFIKQDIGWLKKAKKHPLPINDPLVLNLVKQYFLYRQELNEHQNYKIALSGLSTGSLGRLHHIVLLQHKESGKHKLLDIKPAKDYRVTNWPHGQYYHHSYSHEGERMIAASNQLAAGITLNESIATVNGCQYWAREISPLNQKFKSLLTPALQEDFIISAASQIGHGHSASIHPNDRQSFIHHVETNFVNIINAINIIKSELLAGWQYYCENCP